MTTTPRRRCPVCYRRVEPTTSGVIYGHWDSAGRDVCPGSYVSFDVTVACGRKTRQGISA